VLCLVLLLIVVVSRFLLYVSWGWSLYWVYGVGLGVGGLVWYLYRNMVWVLVLEYDVVSILGLWCGIYTGFMVWDLVLEAWCGIYTEIWYGSWCWNMMWYLYWVYGVVSILGLWCEV